MKKLFITFIALLATVLGTLAQDTSVPFDSAVRKGTLPNGLTYYLRHNEWPEKRAYFRIAQRVGSMQEEDHQRGLAHFLEHMSFNGTTHFPGGALKQYLERIGVKFAEDLNAYTSFEQTVYWVDNVNVEIPGALDSCLLILHDWSHDLLLDDEEIDKERGVINEEWRLRRSAMMRMYESALPEVYPGSKYAHRLPIGTMEVVMNFPYQALRDYYAKWYRPDLQAIVIVGDIDVDEMERKIADVFADIAAPPADAAPLEPSVVPDNAEPIITIQKDKEQSANIVYFGWKLDPFPRERKNTPEFFVDDYVRNAISSIFRERVSDILQKPDAPFMSAVFFRDNFLISKVKDAYCAETECEDGKYETAVKATLREVLRARRHGYTAAEYERFAARYLSAMEQAYLHREKVQSGDYVSECIDNFFESDPMPGIEWEYANARHLVETVTVDMVNDTLRAIPTDNLVVAVLAADKEGNPLPTKEQILLWMSQVEAETIEPIEEETSDEPLIDNLPDTGRVLNIEDGPYDSRLVTLGNGVKVYVKHTDFSPNQISMTAVSWGGSSLYGDHEWRQVSNATMAFVGGAGKFSATALAKRMAGKRVNVSPSVGDDSEGITASCAKKDFEAMLQLTYLTFTSPRKDTAVFKSSIQLAKADLRNKEMEPFTDLNDTIAKVLYDNDIRRARVREADMDSIDYDRVIEIYKERFADAADFDFFIVGDCEADSIAPILAKYLGALPAAGGGEKSGTRGVRMVDGQRANVFEKHLQTPSATVAFVYHAPTAFNLKNSLTLSMLQQILWIRYTETVREDEGGSYAVPVGSSLTRFPAEEASLSIELNTAPAKRARMTELIYKGVADMVAQGPKPEELQKVKEYMLRSHEENLKNNGYWMGQLVECVRYGNDHVSTRVETINSITPADIRDMARHVCQSGNVFEIGMTSPEEDWTDEAK